MTRTALFLSLLLSALFGAVPSLPAQEHFAAYLPELRRDEMARELRIEWAQRRWELDVATTAAPDTAVALDASTAGGASGVLVVSLPQGAMRGAELAVARASGGRWRFATIPTPYDVLDARALAIAAGALANAHTAAPSDDDAHDPPSVRADPPPAQATEPSHDAALSPDAAALAEARAPRVHIGFDVAAAAGWDWLDASHATPLVNGGVGLGADLQVHDARSGHGVALDYRYLFGVDSGGFTNFIDARYSYRIHERLSDVVGASLTLEAGATFAWGRYRQGLLGRTLVDRIGLGPVLAITGHLLFGPVAVGLEIVYRGTVNPWGSNSPEGAPEAPSLGAGWVTYEHSVLFGLRVGVHLDV